MKRTGDDIIRQVGGFISENRLICSGDRVLAAVSGGPDSIFMLHLLRELSAGFGFELRAAHLDHGLRGKESAADVAFVRKMCRQWGIPLTVGKVDTKAHAQKHKLSIETAAREARREFLRKAAARSRSNLIATGHTAGDQAETVLMHLIRGSGLDGMGGMRVKNCEFIRPLLGVSRGQVMRYLKNNGIPYRNDSSNVLLKHFRNRIRHELLPLLKKYNPQIEQSLCRLAANLESDKGMINEAVSRALNDCAKIDNSKISIDLYKFKLYNKGLRQRIIRAAAETLSGPGAVPDQAHLKRTVDLLSSGRVGSRVFLSGGLWVRKAYSEAVIGKPGEIENPKPKAGNKKLRIPGKTVFGEHVISAALLDRLQVKNIDSRAEDIVYFDAGILDEGGLEVGSRVEGERMVPFGKRTSKKVKELFIDCKVPQARRQGWPVVRSDGKPLWLCGLRRSALYSVTSKTKKVLCLQYTRK